MVRYYEDHLTRNVFVGCRVVLARVPRVRWAADTAPAVLGIVAAAQPRRRQARSSE